ncbi:hypothetical protein WUBG_04926 [Wuchereria bancrofti]|uniref:Uncharacterized protein n=1 Tax=Wuchereria bancrofti TaxID=6293 RepID=J9F9Y6_WUCBA|nr:hypothetical protein WUBG_04926 [Wuchereria bancrofti]
MSRKVVKSLPGHIVPRSFGGHHKKCRSFIASTEFAFKQLNKNNDAKLPTNRSLKSNKDISYHENGGERSAIAPTYYLLYALPVIANEIFRKKETGLLSLSPASLPIASFS